MFSWQQMWNGQSSPDQKNGCCTGPLVEKGAGCVDHLPAVLRFMEQGGLSYCVCLGTPTHSPLGTPRASLAWVWPSAPTASERA